MIGGDATISLDPIELNLQFVERNDDKPLFINQSDPSPTVVSDYSVKTRGAFAEMVYRPNGDDSKWYAVGLFNWIESDFSELNYKTLSGHLGYVFRRNIRMVAEVKYDFTQGICKIGRWVYNCFLIIIIVMQAYLY